MFKARLFVIAVLAFVLVACRAGGSGELGVNDVWARPGLAGGNSAAFFVIDNPGAEDFLLSASAMWLARRNCTRRSWKTIT